MPDVMADGVTSYDFMAINSRVFTEFQREPFYPAFGVGLAHVLQSPTLTPATIRRRLENSFAGDPGYVGLESLEVELLGRTYIINLELEARNGSS